ncbi:hypothetical protein AD929_03315, partial [Gluconobacter potus]
MVLPPEIPERPCLLHGKAGARMMTPAVAGPPGRYPRMSGFCALQGLVWPVLVWPGLVWPVPLLQVPCPLELSRMPDGVPAWFSPAGPLLKMPGLRMPGLRGPGR